MATRHTSLSGRAESQHAARNIPKGPSDSKSRTHVVILVASSFRKWHDYRELGALQFLDAPAGVLPWGHAAGWPDMKPDKKREGKRTHSWHVDAEGVPQAPLCDTPGRLQRHRAIFSQLPVKGLLFTTANRPLHAVGSTARAELAYLLAGVGDCPHKANKFAVWWELVW